MSSYPIRVKTRLWSQEIVALTQEEVEHIVHYWYTHQLPPNNLKDNNGKDLKEILNVDGTVVIKEYWEGIGS